MMTVTGRPREFDREIALQAAMLLFWRKGFLATSMTDLCEAMGIRSPSLYAAFGSKEALYLEAVDHYGATIAPLLWDRLAEGRTARDSIESLLRTAAAILPEDDAMPAGCMSTLGAVSEEWPDAILDTLKKIRGSNLDVLRARLARAVTAGELPPATDIGRLSRFYLGVYEGMALQSRDGANSADLIGIAETAMRAWPEA